MNTLHGFFSAPARYRPQTPWGVWSALAATFAIVTVPMLVLLGGFILVGAFGDAGQDADDLARRAMHLGSPLGVATLLGTQVISLGLVWWLAGRSGLRLETLSLSTVAPSYPVCIALALAFVTAMGLVEFGLYKLINFDLFKDSKFLVEGLRSSLWPFTVFMGVVLAPLWEEMTFRGFLLSALAKTKLGIVGGGLISTSLWALLHASYSVPALLSVFAAGLVMTWLVWKTGNLRVAIVTHAMVNASALIFAGLFSPH